MRGARAAQAGRHQQGRPAARRRRAGQADRPRRQGPAARGQGRTGCAAARARPLRGTGDARAAAATTPRRRPGNDRLQGGKGRDLDGGAGSNRLSAARGRHVFSGAGGGVVDGGPEADEFNDDRRRAGRGAGNDRILRPRRQPRTRSTAATARTSPSSTRRGGRARLRDGDRATEPDEPPMSPTASTCATPRPASASRPSIPTRRCAGASSSAAPRRSPAARRWPGMLPPEQLVAGRGAQCSAGSTLPSPRNLPIDTFVVLMMENRSFDHYFGWHPKADARNAGLAYPDADGQPGRHPPPDARLPGLRLPRPRPLLGRRPPPVQRRQDGRLRAGQRGRDRQRRVRRRLLPARRTSASSPTPPTPSSSTTASSARSWPRPTPTATTCGRRSRAARTSNDADQPQQLGDDLRPRASPRG